MHAGQLTERRRLKVDIETLALANEWSTVGSHVENLLLTDLPDSLVDSLDIVGDVGDVLNRAIVGNDHVLHRIIPEAKLDELPEEPRANDLEFTGEDTAGVDVAGVGLEALVVAQNLTGRCSRHRSDQEGVPQPGTSDFLLERSPVPEVRGGDAPKVVLEFTQLRRASHPCFVRTIALCEFRAGFERSVVDRLEDLDVELLGLRRIKWHAKSHESIGQTLHTDTDGSVAHV